MVPGREAAEVRVVGIVKMSDEEDLTELSPDEKKLYTTEDLRDINVLAAKELLRLIHEDQSLAPEWKGIMLDLLKNGVPEDITPLFRIIEEEIHATTQKTDSEELPRDH